MTNHISLYGGASLAPFRRNINFINNYKLNDCKMKKHDENRDLRSVSKIAKITPAQKTIECSKTATIGIHMWGKIDFLTKYCGWVFIWNNSAGTSYGQFDNADKSSARAKKKAQKEPKLTDKTKKKSNKK